MVAAEGLVCFGKEKLALKVVGIGRVECSMEGKQGGEGIGGAREGQVSGG